MLLPKKPLRFCVYPGCNQLVSDGSRCEHHRQHQQREQDKWRGSAASRGYDNRWSKRGGVREMKLKRDPLCERCKQAGVVRVAVLVHHVKPISSGGAVLDMDNLMSLCRRCHDAVHSKD